jgi:UDP-N-acetylglucosamine 2-epimerase (non-hydrolysing)
MYNIFNAVKRIVDEHEDIVVVYPIHKNPKVREIAKEVFDGTDRILLIEPLGVDTFHNYIKKSFFILTDSGGIQEEAPALGKPVLVARETTERPEGVEAGVLKLVGIREKNVYDSMDRLLADTDEYECMSKANNPYGDGHASERIVDILLKSF